MTSPSRRKRPTTPQSTRRPIRRELGTLPLVLLFSASALFAGEAQPALERLKQRSPHERWQESRRQWAQPAPTEADEPFRTAGARQPDETRPLRPIPDQARSVPPAPTGEDYFSEPIRDPRQLKKVTEILPFFDYEPSADVRRTDPCMNLCPRPQGAPCPDPETLDRVPDCPDEITLGDEPYFPRLMPASVFTWEASNFWHNPLYFEDAPLERYGHTYPHLVQPFVSGGRFAAHLLGLPYQMTIDPICKRVYSLGWYRPGECAPKLCYQVPWNTRAAINQAAVVTGFFFIFP